MSKDYSLSLRGEAFNSLCADFDTTLRDVLAGMIETEQNTGEINIKVKITLTDDSAPDYWKQQKRRGYITPEEYQQLAEEFIGARPVKNKEDETNGKDP